MIYRLLFVASCLLFGPVVALAAADARPATTPFQSAVAADTGGGWYAGVEATFLTPHKMSSGPILFQTDTLVIEGGDPTAFDQLEGAPRVWLGRRGDQWGARGRYWLYDANTSNTLLGYGDTEFVFVSAAQLLSAKTGDLEVTRCFGLGQWGGDLFLGARWAEFQRDASLNVGLVEAIAADPFPVIASDTAWFGSGNISTGVGFTFGFDARRPVGDWGLGLVLNARGSTLWGNAGSRGYQSYLGEGVLAVQTAEVDDTGTLWIGELQAGLEWSGPLRYLNAEVFTHVVFEYQFWRSSNQTPFLMDQQITTPTNDVRMTTGSLSPDLDLVGVSWAVGFRR